jgi:hypothetical protein
MLNAGVFIPVNGRGRKLLFDPDAVEAWIKARQPPVNVNSPTVTCPAKQERDRKKRVILARAIIDKHRKPNPKAN